MADVREEASKLFCNYVWVSLNRGDVLELFPWLEENMGEPFYREDQAADLMPGKRWSLLKPINGNPSISSLRVHFADPKDALLFKLRWG